MLQLGALRDALIEAGASPEKASAAAEELAGYENRLGSIEARLATLESKVTMLIWAIGLNIALSLAQVGILLAIK